MGVKGADNFPLTVPEGQVPTIITHLEMLDRPILAPHESSLVLEKWHEPPVAEYLKMFRAVGEPWLWTSRLLMTEKQLQDILHRTTIEIFVARENDRAAGFIELDFGKPGECEIAFFGLIAEMNGKGHGHWLMNQALDKAWRDDIKRVWLHTCTQDSPRALPFYQRSGFRIFKQQMDMMPDPRLSGHLPRGAAPAVPILG